MTAKRPPNKIRVLTRLKISEVSAVDRGAGEQCRVLIQKKYDPDARPLTRKEIAHAKSIGRTALRHLEEAHKRHQEDRDADIERLTDIFTRKSFAADARGDEADDRDEATSVDELGGEHHASKAADLLVESGKYADRAQALDYLLHHPRGAAMLQRLSKKDSTPMSLDLSAVVKAHGIGALCRHMIKSASNFGIDEHQLVELATQDAARRYPSDTPPQAFAKLFMESSELRDAIEIAKGAALQDAVSAEIERDSRKACDELAAIGKQRWPNLTPSQRFARAFETNPELAKRAHRRPSPSTSFAHPVAKMQPEQVSLEPRVSTETDVDDPNTALAQLSQIARDKWPNETEARAFLNVMTDSEHGDLIRRALARPTASSPPRR